MCGLIYAHSPTVQSSARLRKRAYTRELAAPADVHTNKVYDCIRTCTHVHTYARRFSHLTEWCARSEVEMGCLEAMTADTIIASCD